MIGERSLGQKTAGLENSSLLMVPAPTRVYLQEKLSRTWWMMVTKMPSTATSSRLCKNSCVKLRHVACVAKRDSMSS